MASISTQTPLASRCTRRALLYFISLVAGWGVVSPAVDPARGEAAPVALAQTRVAAPVAVPAAPVAIPAGGWFVTNISVTLTAAVPEIRFTLDGSEPTTHSARYAGPLTVERSALLRARAFGPDGRAGALMAASYLGIETNLLDFSSNLPLLVLSTLGRTVPSTNSCPGVLRVLPVEAGGRARFSAGGAGDQRVSIKLRGFSSRRNPKRSYALELLDPADAPREEAMLGLPADSEWVLYAPYSDKSLIRDVLAYELSREVGRYASRTRFVEVFLHDSTERLSPSNYVGVYVFEEKIKRSPHRVPLQKLGTNDLTEPAISGGYILKKDHLEKAENEAAGEVAVKGRSAGSQIGFPTARGGFPADPAGFLPTVTNVMRITTNLALFTVMTTQHSLVVITSQVPVTTLTLVTNPVVELKPVVTTGSVVAVSSVAGTNVLVTTNVVDPQTVVINTSITVASSATYRTNRMVMTNAVAVTNSVVQTNAAVSLRSRLATNVMAATVPQAVAREVVVTNFLTAADFPPVPASPLLAALVTTGQGLVTTHTNAFFFVEPRPGRIAPEQRDWITRYLNGLEAALNGPEFRDPVRGYPAYLDPDSFIDHHLFVEVTKNIDGYRFSTYFVKDRGGRLRMEPIWDWNLALGNAKARLGYRTDQWYWPQLNDQQYSWFRRLFEDPDFAQRYVDRWAVWRAGVFQPERVLARIDEIAGTLREAAERNFARWPILGDQVAAEYPEGKTHAEEIAYLKAWVTNRIAWVDAQFLPPPAVVPPGTGGLPAGQFALAAAKGQVYFTLDGTDPRQPGGVPAPAARRFSGPVALTNAVRVMARTALEDRWSPPVTVLLPAGGR